jgi:hypothetical protein
MWYLSIWERVRGAVFIPQGHGPDAPGHPSDDGVFGVHAVGKEKGEVGAEPVDGHAPGQVVLQVGEPVGQGEGQLGDRIGAGLGDVVAGYGYRIEIAHIVFHEIGLDVAHHLEGEIDGEDAGVLPLVLFQNVRLHRAAHIGEHLGPAGRRTLRPAGGPWAALNRSTC